MSAGIKGPDGRIRYPFSRDMIVRVEDGSSSCWGRHLHLTINLPRDAHVRRGIQCQSLWSFTGRHQIYRDQVYYEVVATWGPFLYSVYTTLEGSEFSQNVGLFEDGKVRHVSTGLYSGLEEKLGTVTVQYRLSNHPNGYQTEVQSDFLESLIQEHSLPWHIQDLYGRKSARPNFLIPEKGPIRTYVNAHNETTWGGSMRWRFDKGERWEEIFVGAYHPSEEAVLSTLAEAEEILRSKAAKGERASNPVLCCHNIEAMKERYPHYEIPTELLENR